MNVRVSATKFDGGKTEFSDGRIMTLKFDIGDLLTICYLHTKFRPNLKGVIHLLC